METPDDIKNILNSVGDMYSRSRRRKTEPQKQKEISPKETQKEIKTTGPPNGVPNVVSHGAPNGVTNGVTTEVFTDPQQKYVINELTSKYGYTKERAMELWRAIK